MFAGSAGLAALVCVVTLSSAGTATANFPRLNGLLAVDTSRDGNTEIYVNADQPGERNLTNHPDDDRAPRWSADGSRIAFFRHPPADRNGAEIYVMDADGSNPTRLTFNSVRDEVPAWTADGRIVFSRHIGPGNWDTVIVNADGSNEVVLTNAPGLELWPAPSPHGGKVSFSSDATGRFEIYTMKLDGTNLRQITSGGGDSFSSDWSPHGNDIVFLRDVTGLDNDVWLVHSDGTRLRRLTATAARVEFFPSWSPDGSSVVYQGCTDFGQPSMICEIYTLDVATGMEQQLTTRGAGYPSWQPLRRP
jgi:Tol biopolymer transport system component